MIPEQTLLNYPLFGDNATKVEPDNNKKSNGWQQADVVPAEWMNWAWYHNSKGISDLNDGVKSMEKEIGSVLSKVNITPSEAACNQLVTAIIDIAHPIGSLFWTSKAPNNGGDPNVLFGGLWVQIKDKFILAAGDTYSNGATGGEATVTLTSDQMPRHSHGGITTTESNSHTHSGTSDVNNVGHTHNMQHTHSFEVGFPIGTEPNGSEPRIYPYYKTYSGSQIISGGNTNYASAQNTGDESQNHVHTFTTGNANSTHTHGITGDGGDKPHNNMPPYIVKYCWERTA